MKKIALEEHFITKEFLSSTQQSDFTAMNPSLTADLQTRLLDIHELRIAAMDKANIEIAVLSLTDPGLQQKDLNPSTASKLSSQVNDFLAEQIARQPKRFRGFAQLAMQEPQAAAKELKRCVHELHFVGALINGQTNGHYLDDAMYQPFWQTVQELDVPVYIHPGSPQNIPESYQGLPELSGAFWGWGVETATHILRLVVSGLFDRYPHLKIIAGHMGETLPYLLWRFDSRWNLMKHTHQIKKQPSQYIRENIYITTSGVCSNGPLLCALEEMGSDRVMFSADYPYESLSTAAAFIDNAPLSEEVREKVSYKNAKHLLKI